MPRYWNVYNQNEIGKGIINRGASAPHNTKAMSIQSREAFVKQIQSGEYRSKQLKIYRALVEGPRNLDDLRSTLGIAHQTLTSALSRLMDMGVIGQWDSGPFYRASPDAWNKLAQKREDERYARWRKIGEDNDWIKKETTQNPTMF